MAEVEELKGKRDRSPSFPYVGLAKAVDLTRTLYDKAKRHEALLGVIAKDWGLAATSSSTLRSAAALQAFGLAEQSGSGPTRRIKVSELGWRILEDRREGAREALLGEAALKPALIGEYAIKWADGRPDNDHAISQLMFESGFTEDGAPKFLRVFDETKRFFPRQGGDEIAFEDIPDEIALPKVGDLVRWISQGVVQIDGRQVVGLSDDNAWVFIDGSSTGIPSNEVEVIERGQTAQRASVSSPAPPNMPPVTVRQPLASSGEPDFVVKLGDGLIAVIEIKGGSPAPRHLAKLARFINLQEELLEDEE